MVITVHTLLTALGWIGAIGTAGAYLLVSRGRLAATSLPFQGLNAVGAGFLALSAAANTAWPSAIVNLAWLTIGVAVIGQQAWRATQDRRTPSRSEASVATDTAILATGSHPLPSLAA